MGRAGRNHPRQNQRHGGKTGPAEKHQRRVLQPDEPQRKGQEHRCNMVDGKGDARCRGHVGRIGDFLKIGFLGNRQRKKRIVDDIQHAGHRGILHESIGDEHADQTGVLEGNGRTLAIVQDQPANFRGEEEIEEIVQQKQGRDIFRLETEFLHHQPGRKHHENLPPRPAHKIQRIIQPVALAQHKAGVLDDFLRKAREGQAEEQGGSNANQPKPGKHDFIVKVPILRDQPDRAKRQNLRHGRGRHHTGQKHRCLAHGKPLQRQRLVHRLVIMEANRHEQRGQVKPGRRRKIAGDGNAKAQNAEREPGEGLLAQQKQHEYCGKGQQPRNFPHRLLHTDFISGGTKGIAGKIVDQRLPSRKAGLIGRRGDNQKHARRAPAR